jgi:pimeloyl-ACP methyl ester carboxylesterase
MPALSKCLLAFLPLALADLDPDDHKTIEELIEEKGYPVEEHFIQTPDGYILGTFRIPYNRNENSSALSLNKPVVILQHGLEDSAYTWTTNPIDESLSYILSDAGYDVWMPNNRGNRYSQENVYYSKHTDEFWNLTWDEMARTDVYTVLDYILDYTGNSQVAYVGHSEGTIQMFGAPYYDKNNELAEKVAFFGALAPVAYVYHCESPLIVLMADLRLDEIFELFGIRQFLPGTAIDVFGPDLCSVVDGMCDFFLELICGPSNDLNETRIQVYVSGTPADTSVKNMAHWAQGVRRDKFEMFDYGSSSKNEAIYGPGMKDPPQYDLSKLNVPTVLYSGTNDWLADPKDVARLVSEMNPEYLVDHIVVDGYAHLDFVWGMHAHTLVYDDLVQRIQKYLGPGVTMKSHKTRKN